jgi:hypothetical protein
MADVVVLDRIRDKGLRRALALSPTRGLRQRNIPVQESRLTRALSHQEEPRAAYARW